MKPPAADPIEAGSRSQDASPDLQTARAFASSWNTVRPGSVYTDAQFEDWMRPLERADFRGTSVIELGYGNGSLLAHVARCGPARLAGVELGDTEKTARANIGGGVNLELIRADLCEANAGEFDIAYCIGVLHHLKEPRRGIDSLLRHTKPGGRFHAWVYGREGNALVRLVVEPTRRIACRLPWWFTKYLLAAPLVFPYFLWARTSQALRSLGVASAVLDRLPLAGYTRWIAPRPFWFFHHVAFDQLVTPQTTYFSEADVRAFLDRDDVDRNSIYVIARNGNSWKFGGRRRETARS